MQSMSDVEKGSQCLVHMISVDKIWVIAMTQSNIQIHRKKWTGEKQSYNQVGKKYTLQQEGSPAHSWEWAQCYPSGQLIVLTVSIQETAKHCWNLKFKLKSQYCKLEFLKTILINEKTKSTN